MSADGRDDTAAAEAEALAPGVVVAEVYQIVDGPTRGGMGLVYRARHRLLGDLRALKVVRPDRASPALAARLLREGRALMDLRHDAIVACRDVVWWRGQAVLVLDWIEAPSLAEHGASALAAPDVAQVGARLLAAIAHAHDRGVSHLDVTPRNVLVPGGDPGRAMLIDFGLTASARSDEPALGERLGTPRFCAPERLVATTDASGPAADVFAAAAVLAVAAGAQLTGTPSTPAEQAARVRHA